MTDKIVILSSCGSEEEAAAIARRLVEEKLAACVSVVAPVKSFYRWRGEIQNTSEWLLVIKTARHAFDSMRKLLESAHSYELPEVLALPVVEGSPTYLAWLDSEVIAAEQLEETLHREQTEQEERAGA